MLGNHLVKMLRDGVLQQRWLFRSASGVRSRSGKEPCLRSWGLWHRIASTGIVLSVSGAADGLVWARLLGPLQGATEKPLHLEYPAATLDKLKICNVLVTRLGVRKTTRAYQSRMRWKGWTAGEGLMVFWYVLGRRQRQMITCLSFPHTPISCSLHQLLRPNTIFQNDRPHLQRQHYRIQLGILRNHGAYLHPRLPGLRLVFRINSYRYSSGASAQLHGLLLFKKSNWQRCVSERFDESIIKC